MMDALVVGLLWFCALGCGLLGGLYFAFSAFIMTALERLGQSIAIAAMNSINRTILRSLFMPFFFGTTFASLALAIIGLLRWRWDEAGALAMAAGGIVYVIGMFVCTMAFNAPLNNALMRNPDSADLWARYLRDWTLWNHVRTIACVGACALFIFALIEAT
jgi:uncharacterized membrane protein